MALFSRPVAKALAVSILGAGAIAFTSAPTACSSSAQTVADPCGGAPTCQTKLTILHTSDVHSRLFPYDLLIAQVDSDLGLGTTGSVKNVGGVARMAYVLGRERARSDRVLHLDSGDYFEGAPIFNFFAGEPEMRAASALGTDAMALGNHEFDKGAVNAARQIQKWADFPVLAANYKFNDPLNANSSLIGTVINPFTVFNQAGLKIAVIGMGNISSLASLFDQPNSLGILPLNTAETAQFYVDLLRPYVDVVILLTHLGLDADEQMVHETTGIDLVVGGHNHIVINPPQQLQDCTSDPNHPGYVWAVDPNIKEDPTVPPPNDLMHPDPVNHPYQFQRPCKPRNVLVMHSGAFSKYVGRLDLVLTNDPAQASPTGNKADYDPINRFEILYPARYQAFPIDDSLPDDPVLVDMLQPYQRTLDRVADLNILAGFSPTGAKRIAPQQGDSPLGNLVSTSMWLRLGVQTDFALTNSTGIRTDLNPGPVPIEEMFNIFPFDNTITKMELSGLEVRELFDFVARRSAGRSCDSQAQIAGARVRINCSGCNPLYRPDTGGPCTVDSDCSSGANGACDLTMPSPGYAGTCAVTACAEEIYIGHQVVAGQPVVCNADVDCAPGKDPTQSLPGQCDKPLNGNAGTCLSPVSQKAGTLTNLYELATNNYIAAGGSGFRVLQRNTTQFDTLIAQRDALTDYMRQGKPCGYDKNVAAAQGGDGLLACSTDADCANVGDFVCACAGHSQTSNAGGIESCVTDAAGCDKSVGRCVRRDCRDQVSQFHEKACATSPERLNCQTDLNGCSLGGEECKFLACVDETEGAATDNRIFIIK